MSKNFPFSALRRFAARLAVGLALVLPALTVPTLGAEAVTPLVGVDWLKAHLNDLNLVVLDIRSAIDGGGVKAYEAAHIPGSVHSDYDKAGWRVTRNNVPFMVPTAAELEKLIGDLGIDEDTHVVVVPAGVNVLDFGSAARTYWTLKYAGVGNVSILDGGVAAWQAGRPAGRERPQAALAQDFQRDARQELAGRGERGRDHREKRRRDFDRRAAGLVLHRQREGAGFAGLRPHPGRAQYRQRRLLRCQDQQTEAESRTRPIANGLSADPVVAYCNTGHWASTDWFVLHELLGNKAARLYAGSMVEWTSNASRPLASSRTKWDDLKKALGLGS